MGMLDLYNSRFGQNIMVRCGYSYIGDFMMATVLWCWISKLSPTETVANIRRQHRCSRSLWTRFQNLTIQFSPLRCPSFRCPSFSLPEFLLFLKYKYEIRFSVRVTRTAAGKIRTPLRCPCLVGQFFGRSCLKDFKNRTRTVLSA